MNETDENSPSQDAIPFRSGREPWLNEAELDEIRNLKPTTELWQPPEDFPEELMDEMAREVDVEIIHEGFYGDDPPADWTLDMARAFVNVGRKKTYRLWQEGKLRRME